MPDLLPLCAQRLDHETSMRIARIARNIARNTRCTGVCWNISNTIGKAIGNISWTIGNVIGNTMTIFTDFSDFLGRFLLLPCCYSNDYLFFFQVMSSRGIRQ